MSKVADYMEREYESVSEKTSLHDAFKQMYDTGALFLIVENPNRLIGIVTRKDMFQACEKPEFMKKAVLRDVIANRVIVSVHSEDFMEDAARLFDQFDIGQLIVVDNLRPVGVLTKDGLMKWYWEKYNSENPAAS